MLEYQRYGRNKETLINKRYIESGEYRRKFDCATDNPKVNQTLYKCAKKALKHRIGTVFEDMYWIDGDTGEILFSVTDSALERTIAYTNNIKKSVKKHDNVITIHTHPSSMPPSIEDFNSCLSNGYRECFVACHDGKLFKYLSKEKVSPELYELYIKRFRKYGYEEFNAQISALNQIKENYNIEYEEVVFYG